MQRTLFTFALVVAAGCDKSSPAELPDGAPMDSELDARVQGTARTHTLFIATEGLDVIVGPDDATANASSIATRAATLTSYLASDPQRGSKISGLVGEIASKVAPYGIEIVTARPAAGPYHIIVITDDSNTAIDASANPAVLSTTLLENPCNQVPSAISFVFGASDHNEVVEATIDMFANLNGVPESTGPHDCMCRVGPSCADDLACTIGGPNTPVSTIGNCGVTGTMDENAMFLAAFGPR